GRLWVRNRPRQLAQLDPTTESAGAPGPLATGVLDLPGQPALVAPAAGGIFVAFVNGGVAYYDRAAVTNNTGPTAQLPRGRIHVENMSVALDGAVILRDYDNSLDRWDPSAR
ncbi:MAG: hypothetical protein JO222_06920, partial [Frankiales bacterium]|nr:hypothetical protein [Frankiales bacterium]